MIRKVTIYLREHETISALLLLTLIEFVTIGINIPKLGFYYDDWYLLWSGSARGAGSITSMFSTDRPYMGSIYSYTYQLFGDSILAWHTFAFILRLLGGFGFYILLNKVFPRLNALNLFMTAIFYVYPGFLSQPDANTKQNHLIGYGSAIYSILFNVLAIQARSTWKKVVAAIISGLLALNYLFIYEYMIGLEAARVIFLVIAGYKNRFPDLRRVLYEGLMIWIAPAIAVCVFLYWRFFIFVSIRSATNVDRLVSNYIDNLQEMTYRLVFQTARDFFDSTVFAWFVKPYSLFRSSDNTDLFVGLILSFMIGVLLIRSMERRRDVEEMPEARLLMLSGLAITLAAIFPVVLSNREFDPMDAYKSYGLHLTMGVALFMGGLYPKLKKGHGRLFILTFFILSITTQYLNGIEWARFWELEKQVWWQLTYRAPDIEDGTLIVTWLPDGTQLQQDYEIWAPVNLIYREGAWERPMIQAEVFHSSMYEKLSKAVDTERLVRDIPLTQNYGKLLLFSQATSDSCAHFYDGEFLVIAKNQPYQLRDIAQFSSTRWIRTDQPNYAIPPKSIFGDIPERTWCFYYQSAELALQKGDWQAVANLYDQVITNDLHPTDKYEWFPFVQGLMNVDRYPEANKLYSTNLADVDYYQIQICENLTREPNFREQDGYRADLLYQMVCSK